MYFYVYYHKSKKWSTFSGKGSYDCPQRFKDWWVIQEVRQDSQINVRITGTFTFVNRETLEKFIWNKTPDTEVLGIWGTQMIYRIKDELYSAQIIKDKITGDKLLIKDSRINNVHWIFPKDKTKN